jgi:hypothetical protein
MGQEYKLRTFDKGDYTDPHGNYWCTATFEGLGEPVKWVVKDPTKVHEGQTVYGEIKEMTSKAGKPYMRFYKQQRPDGEPTGNTPSSERSSGYKDNSDGMRQGMCINNATQFVNVMSERLETPMAPEEWAEAVYAHAQALYLKGDLKKAAEVTNENLQSVGLAKQDAVYELNEEQPIDLNDIPF